MKAAVYRRYGPPDVVQIAELPRPDVAPKDVLVKVRATTVTAGDSRLRSANVPRGFGVMVRLGFGIFGPRKPILGSELAGEVAAVGQSVSRFAPGEKVFAARMGCHAEYVTVPEDRVAPMPGNLTFGEAAALTFGGLTALFYLRDQARIQPRERVLINGASGAVGSAAVQLAKHFGAVVTGVCSAANAPLVRSLGAHRVVDYAKEDFAQTRETYDVILDAVGNCPFDRCKPVLAPGGRLLLVVASLGQMVGALVRSSRAGRKVRSGVVSVRAADLLFLRALAESGAFKPVIDRTYPFARIVDAHAYVDTGRKKGNVVITLD
ncbi:MAG TPA: NAD(P)-dependent alcohol dehydrogenase [Gemmatimonadales bacterium]|nr:NAD(P)-dependent alcohol dehydrogenase [Gemmatimonadales bacterium]